MVEKPYGNAAEASSKNLAFCVANALICDSQGLYVADDSEYGRIGAVNVKLWLVWVCGDGWLRVNWGNLTICH